MLYLRLAQKGKGSIEVQRTPDVPPCYLRRRIEGNISQRTPYACAALYLRLRREQRGNIDRIWSGTVARYLEQRGAGGGRRVLGVLGVPDELRLVIDI